MANVGYYEKLDFQIGNNIIISWKHTGGIGGAYYYPLITSIQGSGDMYSDASQFICLTDSEVTWDDLSISSCNLSSQLAIAHDELVIPEGITSIASNFFSGFSTRKLTLPSTLKTIGDYAFAPSTSKINMGFRQLIKELVIPANVEHIGKRAFADMEYCNKITILNSEYIIEDYGSSGDGIFRMAQQGGITYGTEIDEDNCFVTQLYAVNKDNYKYNWKLNYRRSIKSEGTNCVRCYTSCGKILEISLYNEGEIPMYTDVLSYIKNGKLVELNDPKASPVRVCVSDTTKKIMAVSY